MEQYKTVLLESIRNEMIDTVVYCVGLLVIIAAVLLSTYFYYKRMKTKHPSMYHSKKQVKIRRQSIWAAVALTAICVGLCAFFCLSAVWETADAKKDIAEGSYLTYTGSYYVRNLDLPGKGLLFNRCWYEVQFENGECAYQYINSFSEWLAILEGSYEGTVVYGKNSRIVVDMEGNES